MESYTGNIMTLSNSIIGVSILAMPFCFKQCGVILSILMLILSSIVTRLTSHFLLKSAIMARRRTFELLAFHAFGTTGKFMVELGIIGFLMGTCIAFFVIIGDLAPAIIAKLLGNKPTDTLRTSILIGVALFCVLPLGLLKNVDSLHSVSTATIGFYFCLVLKTFSESATHFVSGNWLDNIEMWRPIGVLQCLPIFSMALSCQTQLFEIYETVSNPTLDKMNYIVRIAINICVAVYISVGFFGYAAFASEPFTGNILMSFSQSPVTDAMKIGFVLSVAFSFPLVIFPCRASLYSLLFKKGYQPYEGASNYIPESKFKFLTFLIVATSLTIGILIPNIEVVLGLLGSTIGIMICMIFPVTCFICISTKNTNERLVAQFLLFIGVIVMVMGTYANLYAMEQINDPIIIEKSSNIELKNLENEVNKILPDLTKENILETKKEPINIKELPIIIKDQPEEMRLEPPQPVEPREESQNPPKIPETKPVPENIPDNTKKDENKSKFVEKIHEVNLESNKEIIPSVETVTKKTDEVDIEAIKKEDKELQEEEKIKQETNQKDKEKEVDLIKTIEQYKEEQKKLIEEQKELIEERKQAIEKLKEKQKIENEVEQEARRKAASQIIEIAKKAIEQLAPEVLKKPENQIDKKKDEVVNEKQVNEINDKVDLKVEKAAEKIENKNAFSNNRLIPIPMAVNKTFSEILKDQTQPNINNNNINNLIKEKPEEIKLNDNKQNEIPNKIDLVKLAKVPEVMPKVPEVGRKLPEGDQKVSENDQPKILPKTPEVEQKVVDVPKVQKIVQQVPGTKQIIPERVYEVKPKIPDPKMEQKLPETPLPVIEPKDNPARRDILTNEESTDNLTRLKREINENSINEECERTEKSIITKTESPLIKLMTEMTKTDLKIDSHLMDSLKTQLNSESIHIKRKRK